MKFNTGRGTTITLLTMIAIWSVSAVTSLPGLAVSPIMGDLTKIFPHTTNLEIQMLTSLPSLLIIPFLLLSGHLAVSKDKAAILIVGLSIFALSGILYMVAQNMTQLIVISCLLGIGAGIVIPMSTSIIADFFTGKYRTNQLGISSSITNLTLVLATLLTGWLANFNWHYPFAVYIIPVVSIILIRGLKIKLPACPPGSEVCQRPDAEAKKFIDKKTILKLMLLYFVITYAVTVVAINLPFLIEARKIDSSATGAMISLFFLAIMLPGLFINKIISLFRGLTNVISLAFIGGGLLMVSLFHNEWMIGAGCFFTGLGYGVMQPIIYDKTADTASPERVTLAMAFVMSVNYLAILVCPFIVDFFQWIFHDTSNTFPFLFNGILMVVFTVAAFFVHKGTIMGMEKR